MFVLLSCAYLCSMFANNSIYTYITALVSQNLLFFPVKLCKSHNLLQVSLCGWRWVPSTSGCLFSSHDLIRRKGFSSPSTHCCVSPPPSALTTSRYVRAIGSIHAAWLLLLTVAVDKYMFITLTCMYMYECCVKRFVVCMSARLFSWYFNCTFKWWRLLYKN